MNEHFIEFRLRLLHCCCCVAILFAICWFYAKELYSLVASPLLSLLPAGEHLIATSITATFLVPLKLAFFLALLLSTPFILWQFWSFIAPGLYATERKYMLPVISCSCLLFYLGVSFGYLVICNLALKFFTSCAPAGVLVMTDISNYLEFISTICFANGLAFQTPVILWVLVKMGVVSKEQLIRQRRVVIVAAFILGMLLTPPDVISQILLALPICGLFEIGLLAVKK